MGGVIFSVTLSVSLAAALLFLLKGTIVRRYGFKMIYILSLIMAIRLIIPYSIQLPDTPLFSIVIPFYVPIIWVVGALICMLFQVGKYIYLKKKILGNSKCVTDETFLRQYESVKSGLFIDDEIPLLRSVNVNSPMLLGFFKPCIVLPMHSFSENETEMVLRHELMHYRNKDSFKKLFFAFVTAVQWFNPFAWLIMRQFYGSLECMCDEAVTKNTDRQYKKNYCYMLLKTGEQSRNLTTAATYFSTKEVLKMRIDSVFEGKKKKSGTALITSFAVCLAVLSGFLCSCTVETPDDVKEEMSRVESGVENEKEADESATEEVTEGSGLMPVSEVVSSAQQTIDEWNSKDGIFKFDNCNVMIPQVTEFPEYDIEIDAGLDTPEKKYAQFKEMEKEIFGEDFFNEDEFLIVPADQSSKPEDVFRLELTLDEYLSGNDSLAVLCNSKDECKIENRYSSVWYDKIANNIVYRENQAYLFSKDYLVKRYDCLTATDAELAEEYALIDGTVTIAEAIECAESTMAKYAYSEDENIIYKPYAIEVYDRGDGTYAFAIWLHVFYGDIPFVNIAKNYDETDEITINANVISCTSDMNMVKYGEIGSLISSYTNTALTLSGNSTTEILSVNQVLEILKDRFSNSIVYEVQEFKLGYVPYTIDEAGLGDVKTALMYDMTLKTTSYEIQVSIDAVTGQMNFFKNRTGSW